MVAMLRLSSALLVLSALLLMPGTDASAAQDREGTRQLVYYPLVTDGNRYQRVTYPQQVETIHVLAGTNVVLEARETLVSFWPITREYLADFAKLDKPVGGTVEITRSNGERTYVKPEPYTVWYPEGVTGGRAEVHRGEEAKRTYEEYVAEAKDAAKASRKYERKVAEHQAAIDEWLAKAAAGVKSLPDPPEELTAQAPERDPSYATEVREAPVINLPAGTYTVRLLAPDGAPIPGSERQLVSFAPLAEGVGYEILPEDRWTQPVTSFDPNESLYVTGGSDIFLRPVVVHKYNAYQYARLLQPQTVQDIDRSRQVWVPRGPVEDAQNVKVALWGEGGKVAEIPRHLYRVSQQPDSLRGYTIEEFEDQGSSLEPDFRAIRLPMNQGDISRLALVDSDGTVVANSSRQVRNVGAVPDVLVYAPALVPLVLLTALRWRRRRQRTRR